MKSKKKLKIFLLFFLDIKKYLLEVILENLYTMLNAPYLKKGPKLGKSLSELIEPKFCQNSSEEPTRRLCPKTYLDNLIGRSFTNFFHDSIFKYLS